MSCGHLLTLLILLANHGSESQEQTEIKIALKGYIKDYSPYTCHKSGSMIQGLDRLSLTGTLAITGFNTSNKATFGLVSVQTHSYIVSQHLATQIHTENSVCLKRSQEEMDTCICTHLDASQLHFACNLTASCKMSERLYFYMVYNNTFYYTDPISVVRTDAHCEVPPGPFSPCLNGKEKRTVTYRFDYSRARSSCMTGLLHGVDRFNMTGRINLNGIPRNSTIFVNFAVASRSNNNSLTYLGTSINLFTRECIPLERKLINSCACLRVEHDGFSVVCTFLASLEHSQKMGLFEMNIDGGTFYGEFVKLPLVLDECEVMHDIAFLDRLVYISLVFLLVVVIGALLYIFLSRPVNVDVHRANIKEEPMDIIYIPATRGGETCVDVPALF